MQALTKPQPHSLHCGRDRRELLAARQEQAAEARPPKLHAEDAYLRVVRLQEGPHFPRLELSDSLRGCPPRSSLQHIAYAAVDA